LEGRKGKIVEMLEEWKLDRGERLPIPVTDYHSSKPNLIRRKDASNLSFGFSFVINRDLSRREYKAMAILNHILNGTMSSKIFGTARSRGIVYGMGSDTGCDSRASNWDFDGEVNAENASELFDLIVIELSRAINGDISQAEIDQAKTYAYGRLQMTAQTAEHVALGYLQNYALRNTIEPLDELPGVIETIDKHAIVSLVREFLESGISGISVVGNINKVLVDELWNRILQII
jgi:predicted Zn-dependent peptidase